MCYVKAIVKSTEYVLNAIKDIKLVMVYALFKQQATLMLNVKEIILKEFVYNVTMDFT